MLSILLYCLFFKQKALKPVGVPALVQCIPTPVYIEKSALRGYAEAINGIL